MHWLKERGLKYIQIKPVKPIKRNEAPSMKDHLNASEAHKFHKIRCQRNENWIVGSGYPNAKFLILTSSSHEQEEIIEGTQRSLFLKILQATRIDVKKTYLCSLVYPPQKSIVKQNDIPYKTIFKNFVEDINPSVIITFGFDCFEKIATHKKDISQEAWCIYQSNNSNIPLALVSSLKDLLTRPEKKKGTWEILCQTQDKIKF